MNKVLISIFLTILLFSSIKSQTIRSDIGFSAILSNTHLLDEYISKNEYSGNSLSYGINWEDQNEKRILELSFYLNKIDNMTSLMSKATVHDFYAFFSYLYHLNDHQLFNKTLSFYLGPGSSIILHYREQKVASSTKAVSFASLITVDIAAKAILDLSDKFEILGFAAISPLSFAGRMPSFKNPENLPTPVGFLHLFNLINLNSSLGIKYKITDTIFLKSCYNFHYIQIFKWDKFRVLQDSFYLQFGVSF